MLQPKRVKFRKFHKGRRAGSAHSGDVVTFGDFGLQAEESAWITARQIEAARRAITHYVRRGGKVYIRIFPDKSITKKAAETRMGSGKGTPDHWVAVVKRGRIMFEMGGVDEATAKEAMRLASNKLPIPARFIARKSSGLAGIIKSKELATVES
jgi:large subunit ribosomal protein L16